jgi:hypothetical protein
LYFGRMLFQPASHPGHGAAEQGCRLQRQDPVDHITENLGRGEALQFIVLDREGQLLAGWSENRVWLEVKTLASTKTAELAGR